MKVDGLWTVLMSDTEEFYENMQVSEQINRGGTLVLIDGKVYGGGISYYFIGTYESGDSTISMTLQAEKYNDLVPGIFGIADEARLIFSGTIDENYMKLHGHLEDYVDKVIFIEAKRQVDID